MILNWQDTYKERLTDARSALSRIRRGARIFIASACGEPQLLVKTLLDMGQNFADVEVIHFLDLGLTDYTSEIYTEHFRHNALFIGANARAA
ncbi:MAG: acetyl-CoA hydrolase, partial [Syntrophaceae bacterium]|nr:acetyl-CoA hydrolase [Syntrophaceae bacterium]